MDPFDHSQKLDFYGYVCINKFIRKLQSQLFHEVKRVENEFGLLSNLTLMDLITCPKDETDKYAHIFQALEDPRNCSMKLKKLKV